MLFEHMFVYTEPMSTEDQTLSAALHGEALLLAGVRELNALIAQLEALANGHDDTRVECAGNMAGAWFAAPETGDAHALIAAGLLLLAGPVDADMLANAVQAGYEAAGGAVSSPGFNQSTGRGISWRALPYDRMGIDPIREPPLVLIKCLASLPKA